MIIITGALGFIGSCLIAHLDKQKIAPLVAVDDFSKRYKSQNLAAYPHIKKIERSNFTSWLHQNASEVTFVFHLGARTDTTEFDMKLLNRLNLHYTQQVWEICAQFEIPLIYASSAATYGLGEVGFKDEHELIYQLKPLNPYGQSKNEFDKWAFKQKKQPPFWMGLKFFNVYGPNEYHKGRMASVIFHFFNQIQTTKSIRLFRSHRPDYKNGEQKRDFIFVEDVLQTLVLFYKNYSKIENGLYNIGTGQARSFNELARMLFQELNLPPQINYIDTPLDIRDKYQYFTEADMSKFEGLGLDYTFTSLEMGIRTYVKNYLIGGKYY
jgi:ADP-L-glycero-D-manno-heptose 6-epimerase